MHRCRRTRKNCQRSMCDHTNSSTKASPGPISVNSRPRTLELMANLGPLDVLLVYRLDRLSRSAVELAELLRKLDQLGVEVWSVADLPIPACILTDQIADIAAFAESERSAILQRMDHRVRRAAAKGSGSVALFPSVTTSTPMARWRLPGVWSRVWPRPSSRARCSIEKLVWGDCVRLQPEASAAIGFDQRRPVIEKCVRRMGVHSVGVKPHKVAFVRVDYADGTTRTLRFARGDGAAL